VTLPEWMMSKLKPELEGKRISIASWKNAVKAVKNDLIAAGILIRGYRVVARPTPATYKLDLGDFVFIRKRGNKELTTVRFVSWAKPGRGGRDRSALGYALVQVDGEIVMAKLHSVPANQEQPTIDHQGE
jgi:hypothetical protein